MLLSSEEASAEQIRSVFDWFETLSNWGRWGADDELGTLNLITPEVRIAAASLVKEGRTLSLSHELDPANPDRLGRGSIIQRFTMIYDRTNRFHPESRLKACREYVGIVPHGSGTHLDAPSHIVFDGKMYNDVPGTSIDSVDGATRHSVDVVSAGIVTRGVLLDVAALGGRPWLEPGERFTPDDLEAAEARQRVRVREGDALLVHTGEAHRISQFGTHPDSHSTGYDASCLPWLKDRGVALITTDGNTDAVPSGYGDPSLRLPVHSVGIVAMGLWILDNCRLHDLVQTCEDLGRYEFLFLLAALRLVGATSSPVNPLAIF